MANMWFVSSVGKKEVIDDAQEILMQAQALKRKYFLKRKQGDYQLNYDGNNGNRFGLHELDRQKIVSIFSGLMGCE